MPKANVQQKPRRKTRKRTLARVLTLSDAATSGIMTYGHLQFSVALGKSGIRSTKREGDGATPLGRWRILTVYYRPDRLRRPLAGVPVRANSITNGWCDAATDRNYNRRVSMPYPASAERLWRNDSLYDLVAVLDYNIAPRSKRRGSAIFMHVARKSFAPTEGCIATTRAHLLRFLAATKAGTVIAAGRNAPPRPAISAAASDSGKGRLPACRSRAKWRPAEHLSPRVRHGGVPRR